MANSFLKKLQQSTDAIGGGNSLIPPVSKDITVEENSPEDLDLQNDSRYEEQFNGDGTVTYLLKYKPAPSDDFRGMSAADTARRANIGSAPSDDFRGMSAADTARRANIGSAPGDDFGLLKQQADEIVRRSLIPSAPSDDFRGMSAADTARRANIGSAPGDDFRDIRQVDSARRDDFSSYLLGRGDDTILPVNPEPTKIPEPNSYDGHPERRQQSIDATSANPRNVNYSPDGTDRYEDTEGSTNTEAVDAVIRDKTDSASNGVDGLNIGNSAAGTQEQDAIENLQGAANGASITTAGGVEYVVEDSTIHRGNADGTKTPVTGLGGVPIEEGALGTEAQGPYDILPPDDDRGQGPYDILPPDDDRGQGPYDILPPDDDRADPLAQVKDGTPPLVGGEESGISDIANTATILANQDSNKTKANQKALVAKIDADDDLSHNAKVEAKEQVSFTQKAMSTLGNLPPEAWSFLHAFTTSLVASPRDRAAVFNKSLSTQLAANKKWKLDRETKKIAMINAKAKLTKEQNTSKNSPQSDLGKKLADLAAAKPNLTDEEYNQARKRILAGGDRALGEKEKNAEFIKADLARGDISQEQAERRLAALFSPRAAAFQTAAGKADAAALEGAEVASTASRATAENMSQLTRVLARIDTGTITGSELTQNILGIAQQLGFDVPEGLDPSDINTARSILTTQLISERKKLAGQGTITDGEQKALADTLPDLGKTPAANEFNIGMIQIQAERAQEMYLDWNEANAKDKAKGFRAWRAAYNRDHKEEWNEQSKGIFDKYERWTTPKQVLGGSYDAAFKVAKDKGNVVLEVDGQRQTWKFRNNKLVRTK